MKLLQIGPYPPPLGGWSFHIKMFKEHLDAHGVENVVLNIGPHRRVKSPDYVDVQGPLDYLRKVARYSRQGYLVYVHLNGDSAKGLILTLLAQVVAKAYGRKSVLSFHAGVVQSCFAPGFSRHKLLARRAFHLAQGIICNSEQVRQCIQKLGVPADRIAAIPCFSKQYVQHKTVLTSREEQFLSEHSPIFISYLFFWPEYEPETIFAALPHLKEAFPDFGLILVGPTQGSETLMAGAAEQGLTRHILQVGEKEHDNFLSLVERSSLMIRVHASDGVCSSVMEALAKGVPVVADDNGTRPHGVVCFTPGSPRDLAQKVESTMANLGQVKAGLSGLFERDSIQEEYAYLMRIQGQGLP